MPSTDQRPVSLRALFGHRAFAVLFPAEVVSVLGDYLARFALTVLVFDRTSSAAAAALTYAVTFLPAVVGGFVLGHLGDKFPPRRVMIAADVLRGLLFTGMALPGVPLEVLVPLLAVAVFLGPAFTSAEVGFLSLVLPQDMFRFATALRSVSGQLVQVAGFAVGGLVVVLVTPRGALLVNAVTFAVSAVLVSSLGRAPARSPRASDETEPTGEPFGGLWRARRTRPYMAFSVLMGLFVLPEGLAVPFGRDIGAGTVQTGVLVATIPFGSVLGAALVVRVPTRLRARVTAAMAVACGVPLVASAFDPVWSVAAVCWLASGAFAAYQVEAISELVRAIPAQIRSQAIGVVGAWLLGSQGAGFALGALLSRWWSPGDVIAIGGAAGALLALGVSGCMRTPTSPGSGAVARHRAAAG